MNEGKMGARSLPEAEIAPTFGARTVVDRPIAVVSGVNATPATYTVHVDHLNRPIKMTDSTKATVWDALWAPWGNVYSITGTATLDARLPGQWFQLESGLHYNWYRHYDPTLGRYTQPDPLGFVDGPNVYEYAGSNPQAFIDPSGLTWIKGVKWVIEGGRRIGWVTTSTISLKTAIRWRKVGKDICVGGARSSREAEAATKAIEKAANGSDGLIHHPKDAHLRSGNQPHFQTDGVRGHAFYKLVSIFSATTYFGDGWFGESYRFLQSPVLGQGRT